MVILLLVDIAATVALTGKLNKKFGAGVDALGVGDGVLLATLKMFIMPNRLEFCPNVVV